MNALVLEDRLPTLPAVVAALALLTSSAMPSGPLAAQALVRATPRAEAYAGAVAGVPGVGAGNGAATVAGVQLGRAGGSRSSPSLMLAYASARGAARMREASGELRYDHQGVIVMAGIVREIGAPRMLALTGELGAEGFRELTHGHIEGVPQNQAKWYALPLIAAGLATRIPVGRHLALLGQGRIFVALPPGLVPTGPLTLQPAIVVGVSWR